MLRSQRIKTRLALGFGLMIVIMMAIGWVGWRGASQMNALLNDGDEVLIPSPDYPLWTAAVTLTGAKAVHYPCRPENGFEPDPADVEKLITRRTRAIVVINPNNPTGAVYSRATLEALARLAAQPGWGGRTPSDLPLVSLSQAEIERLSVETTPVIDIYQLRHAHCMSLASILELVAKAEGLRATEWIIFECSGTAPGQTTAYGLLVHGATLCVVGFTMDKVEVRLSNLMAFDARAIGNWGCPPEAYPAALDLVLDGKVQIKPFVELHPLDDINRVFDAVHKRDHDRRSDQGLRDHHGRWCEQQA